MITLTHRAQVSALRNVFLANIPKTWSDYFQEQAGQGYWMTAYKMAQLIQEQTKLNFEQAAELCLEINPELGAEYWENSADGRVGEDKMATRKTEKTLGVGSCMFCSRKHKKVNVIQGNGIEIRICNDCLWDVGLKKFEHAEIERELDKIGQRASRALHGH